MGESIQEADSEANAAAVSPPVSAAVSLPGPIVPETADPEMRGIRPRAADAIIEPVSLKKAEEGSSGKSSRFKRLLSYGLHAALAACLFGFAWVAGAHLWGSRFPGKTLWPLSDTAPQESAEPAEMSHTSQQLAEEIRALKAKMEAIHTAPVLSAKDAAALEDLKTSLNAAKTGIGTAIGELAGKVEQLQREFAAKLSQINERLDRIEHAIAAPPASNASAAAVARKRTQRARGDAFDPSQNPNAPGAPRPLGSPAAPASANPRGGNAY